MLKGLALTPPVIGRISIGKVVEKNGKRLPEKDDEFTLTSQAQNRDGWILHPLDEQLRRSAQPPGASPTSSNPASTKLRQIPIRLLFNDPDLNLRAHYSLFDRDTGRQLCVGNGETCKRSTATGMQTLACPAPQSCEQAAGGRCKPYGRLHVHVGDDDELGSFILRTTGFNSIRTLATRMAYLAAASQGLLACLPLELRLRGKSTTQSHRAPIYYVDLTLKSGLTMAQALEQARGLQQERQGAGFDQVALDEAARQGYAQGAFEESEEDGLGVLEEFYPESPEAAPAAEAAPSSSAAVPVPGQTRPTLAGKLGQRVAAQQTSRAAAATAVPSTVATM
jgi:hypothetical protein